MRLKSTVFELKVIKIKNLGNYTVIFLLSCYKIFVHYFWPIVMNLLNDQVGYSKSSCPEYLYFDKG